MNEPDSKQKFFRQKFYQRINSIYIVVFFCGMIAVAAFMLGYSSGKDQSETKYFSITETHQEYFPSPNELVFRKDLSKNGTQVFYFIDSGQIYKMTIDLKKNEFQIERP